MHIAKTYNHRMHCYTLMPNIIVTPLRCQPPKPTPDWLAKPLLNPVTGFRLGFTWWNRNLGMEVRYG